MKHWIYVIFTGFIWMLIGVFLVIKGSNFLTLANLAPLKLITLSFLSLFIGLLKSHFVLKKVVKRVTTRILSQKLPISVFKVYDMRFYLLIISMVILGIILKNIPIWISIRGFLDFAIGIALIKGAIDYFIIGLSFRKISYD